VLAALAQPTVGHMDPWFLSALGETATLLRGVFRTQNLLTLAVPGTGSAGMETMFNNLVEPGDAVLVAPCGYFGHRMVEMARRAQADLTVVESPYGRVVEPQRVIDELKKKDYKVVALVHAETSTGIHQPIEEIAAVARSRGTLVVADTVTSLGGVPVETDAWGLDGVFSCSQKCLCCPPGLSPVTFSDRARERIKARKTKPHGWYLDVSLLGNYWEGDRVYHHTAPVNMVYALNEGLRLVRDEGLPARWERHRRNAAALTAGLEALGLKSLTQEGFRLPQLHCIAIPEGVADVPARKRIVELFGVEIGGGLGEFKGRAWRIGLMGEVCKPSNVVLCLEALERVLGEFGVKVPRNAGVAAAEAKLKDLITAA
jgi:alanine-glyoxylate transaminase/serine-glyoxylate transaminase/serine-pyruvate transaminase